MTPGLGDNSYLLTAGDEAALVDPQRDAWRFVQEAADRGTPVRYVLETHVHNDYVSGAREAQAMTGAEIAAPARGGYAFPHRRMAEGDEIRLGDYRIVALETPGHTPEHLAWVVYRDGLPEPVAVFTGGSLLVGGAGRTDLLGPDLTEELTVAQFHSLRRLAALPDGVQVLPTHGAGSFCAVPAPAPDERTSTMGRERRRNPALAAPTSTAFVLQQLDGLSPAPAYYRHMGPINRQGPLLLEGLPSTPPLSVDQAVQRIAAGAWVVDARASAAFAAAHLPGAINIELGDSFATYVGWVVPFGAPLILVLPETGVLAETVTQLMRIGYEQVSGYLWNGVDDWRESGRPVRSYQTANVGELCQAFVEGRPIRLLDVRQEVEWNAGHFPESMHIFIGDLPSIVGDVPTDCEVWVACATGYRAAIAASLLDRAGIPVRLVTPGGVPEALALCGP
ncbi:MAG: MBL fold metallo-hydrolase [Chloroflexi bacterium]|nr:MBL fold metallo-hydrolase [Chloroflexota bacterium]